MFRSGGPKIIDLQSSKYTVLMKNITLAVDEKVLAAVRRYAADHDSTVNGIVREYLTTLAAHQDRANRARSRLRRLGTGKDQHSGSALSS